MLEHDISKMKVADLKLELKKRGLSTTGNKNDLVDRLQAAVLECGDTLEDTTGISDDLLDDELMDDDLDDKDLLDHDDHEDELLKASPSPDSAKNNFDLKILKSPVGSSTSIGATSSTQPAVHKKIALKRNLSIQAPVIPEPSTTNKITIETKPISTTNGSSTTSGDEPSKKVLKLHILTAEERLKLRAEKFGANAAASVTTIDITADDRKLARAARFGGATSTSSNSSASIKNSAPDASIEVLKKRAERFGAATAPKLSAIEKDEKMKKRQERFGAGSTTVTSTSSDEKAKQRLERFKTAA